MQSELQNIVTNFHLKRFQLLWIEYFREIGYKHSNFSEVCITTISDEKCVTCDFDIKQPVQLVELKLKMIHNECPRLINALDKSGNHPLVRK